MSVRFVREHFIGIVLGVILFELYWRGAKLGGKGGGGG